MLYFSQRDRIEQPLRRRDFLEPLLGEFGCDLRIDIPVFNLHRDVILVVHTGQVIDHGPGRELQRGGYFPSRSLVWVKTLQE